jgi:hypothetical protein
MREKPLECAIASLDVAHTVNRHGSAVSFLKARLSCHGVLIRPYRCAAMAAFLGVV